MSAVSSQKLISKMSNSTELSAIETEILSYISQNLVTANTPLTAETSFSELGIDSYSLIEMLLFLEAKYHCSILDGGTTKQDLEHPQALAKFIASKLKL